MHANVGSADRRVIVGLALVTSAFIPVLPLSGGPLRQAIAVVVGLVLLLTALVRFCPLYRLMGPSTCKVKN